MKLLFKTILIACLAFTAKVTSAAAIILHEKDAIVWLPVQAVSGTVSGVAATVVRVHCNNHLYIAHVNTDHSFKVTVRLSDVKNRIFAECSNNNGDVRSSILQFTMGCHPEPEIKPYAIVKGNKVVLTYKLFNNPDHSRLSCNWAAADGNPAACIINNKNGFAYVSIPHVDGSYYFKLRIKQAHGGISYFTTYVSRSGEKLQDYNMDKDRAAWIDSAVIYEITPSAFVKHGTFNDITAKLPELSMLGINTLWLQPIYKSDDNGQGYTVTGYFNLRPGLGTAQDLTRLISTAKKLHMRVLFDFVPNHTSINHPYAQNCIKYGDSSHYYNFYQHKTDSKPYSSFYHKNGAGFIDYFWDALVNLDYSNPEVQQWIIAATKYWLTKYDIDGYRFDAVWGLEARAPRFAKRLGMVLKSVKPDILLLAEDKASDPVIYASDFDAGYDWTRDTAWVSQWVWQTKHNIHKSLTLFNTPDSVSKSTLLRSSIFNSGNLNVETLRFIENNDVPRFIASHNLAQTKMAAALIFSLPGIPMLYNGQETGCKWHPYSGLGIFKRNAAIQQLDSLALFPYYQKLISIHRQHPALYGKNISEIPLDDARLLAFERSQRDERIIVIVNPNNEAATANINLAAELTPQEGSGTRYLQDLLTDSIFKTASSYNAHILMEGCSIRWLLIRKEKINQLN